MPEKFRNKYRIASHRKPNWDYSADALYFLTIVTQHRKCNLGQVIHSKDISFVELSDFGRIVETELLSIKRNPPKRMPQSISSFMAGFKSAVNTKINDYIDQHQLNIPKYNRHNHFFQANYHDHIIRNYREYINISRYIIQNPRNWGKDKFYGNNKFSRIS